MIYIGVNYIERTKCFKTDLTLQFSLRQLNEST